MSFFRKLWTAIDDSGGAMHLPVLCLHPIVDLWGFHADRKDPASCVRQTLRKLLSSVLPYTLPSILHYTLQIFTIAFPIWRYGAISSPVILALINELNGLPPLLECQNCMYGFPHRAVYVACTHCRFQIPSLPLSLRCLKVINECSVSMLFHLYNVSPHGCRKLSSLEKNIINHKVGLSESLWNHINEPKFEFWAQTLCTCRNQQWEIKSWTHQIYFWLLICR